MKTSRRMLKPASYFSAHAVRRWARPHADLVMTSAYPNMKELRTQHEGRPYRTLFAFDPRRIAILLLGGDKTGNDRWYTEFVPRADKIYAEHLRQLEEESRKRR